MLKDGPYRTDGKTYEAEEFAKIKNEITPSQDVMIVDSAKISSGKLQPSAIPAKYNSSHPMYAGHNDKLTLGFYDGHVDVLPGSNLSVLRSFRGKQPSGYGKKYTMLYGGNEITNSKLNVVKHSMPEEI